jgi:hypothetical protein
MQLILILFNKYLLKWALILMKNGYVYNLRSVEKTKITAEYAEYYAKFAKLKTCYSYLCVLSEISLRPLRLIDFNFFKNL